MEIKSGNTAIRRNGPSRPLKMLLSEVRDLWKLAGNKGIPTSFFDLGCGLGDDIKYLDSLLYDVDGYDPNHKPEPGPSTLSSGSWDVVTCFYVLNVISDPKQRRDVIEDARHLVSETGLVALATRSPMEVRKSIKDGWTEYKDGWITSSGTFQRGFKSGELAKLLFDAGFEAVFNIVDCYSYAMVVGVDMLLVNLEVDNG